MKKNEKRPSMLEPVKIDDFDKLPGTPFLTSSSNYSAASSGLPTPISVHRNNDVHLCPSSYKGSPYSETKTEMSTPILKVEPAPFREKVKKHFLTEMDISPASSSSFPKLVPVPMPVQLIHQEPPLEFIPVAELRRKPYVVSEMFFGENRATAQTRAKPPRQYNYYDNVHIPYNNYYNYLISHSSFFQNLKNKIFSFKNKVI